jgi:hypothetical protein
LSGRDDAGSPASGKNGKEPSGSPGPGSGADSSGTGAALMPTRRGRPGHGNGSGQREPSMAELKKRAALMLEIITSSQLDMARSETRGLLTEKSEEQADRPLASSLAGELATRLVKWQQEFTADAAVVADAASTKG